MRARVQWGKAPDFAQVAEALDVPTTSIAAVMPDKQGRLFVLYTEDENDSTMSSVYLRRGQDGILFRASTPKKHPGMWEAIERDARRRMDDLDL